MSRNMIDRLMRRIDALEDRRLIPVPWPRTAGFAAQHYFRFPRCRQEDLWAAIPSVDPKLTC
jgi:hypothetical protein